MRNETQRKPPEYVNAQALPHSELSSRQVDILLWLLQHPYQRGEDLALALGVHTTSLYRQMKMLKSQGYLESITPSLEQKKAAHLFYLTSRGIQAAAEHMQYPASVLAKRWQADEAGLRALLPRLGTLCRLQELINGLVADPPATLLGEKKGPIQWHWRRQYRHSFLSKGKRHTVETDAVLVFQRSGATRNQSTYGCAFLLIDPGYVGPHDRQVMHAHLENMLRFRESAERWSQYHAFPALLILTTTRRQQHLWQQAAQEAAEHLHLVPLHGAILALETDQHPLSFWTLSWQHLSLAGPIQITQLFTPIQKEALPPEVFAPKREIAPGTLTRQPQEKNLVRGSFDQRAQQSLQRLYVPEGREQEQISLLTTRLQSRHRSILLLLYAHPLLSQEELAIFQDIEVESTRRYLLLFKQWSCLHIHETEDGRRFSLSSRGLRMLAAMLNIPFTTVSEIGPACGELAGEDYRVQRGMPAALKILQHTTGVYRFFASLHQAARNEELLWWETEARCARRYYHQGAWHNLLPDGAFAYRADEQTIHAWLEWDEGTMSMRQLGAKMRADAHYVRSRQWQKEEGTLPMLLIVVPGKREELRMADLIEQYLHETGLIVRSTTATRLADHGPLGTIWLPLFPAASKKGSGFIHIMQGRS
ncbi:replication-relaxation family protein [Tengunoibacter tsumagoiensis]|uniref:Uncharacterized protein n=1 Tax=Tengunoibacter tsumagoiensis TaxID=2014871 RepID=A0A402A081_9CHLR|nr:replication-relaxation family protein [Tengunoibacter tsumagoiensis]GCE12514.1 hypothetical protein KTT_23730 [Tengunoibacter tsumagoiensis]